VAVGKNLGHRSGKISTSVFVMKQFTHKPQTLSLELLLPQSTSRGKKILGENFSPLPVYWAVEVGNKRWKLATFLKALKCVEKRANRK